jgi:hypothetical protein
METASFEAVKPGPIFGGYESVLEGRNGDRLFRGGEAPKSTQPDSFTKNEWPKWRPPLSRR